MNIYHDNRIVMTLDAGGTNFVFSAAQAGEEIIEPIRLPAHGDTLDQVLGTIVTGFSEVRKQLKINPAAISFAFPGPADYPNGIIGDLKNLPTFRGGVALGPMLQHKFGIPTFINNDGDLFVYGEAIAGLLPQVNRELEEAGSPKRFKNLFGITLGTGFGGGMVIDGKLFLGDNSAGAEIWAMRSKLHPHAYAEEGIAIRAVRRVYAEEAGIPFDEAPEPKDICSIAKGQQPGNREAAIEAFRQLAVNAGDALANAITLLDALIVVGGGLSGAADLILPDLVAEMNNPLCNIAGEPLCRTELTAFNLEDISQKAKFLKGQAKTIPVPGTSLTVSYDPLQRIGVGVSRLGTSRAVSIGAYAFALYKLDH
ncbi:MAG TPA: ROK family protein [Bacteroidales bacterium]|nr:ROK family protein [Bacteroidales bacterium]HPT02339.1 ROK family protein [Bacteroidales bacterium]